MNEKVGLTWGDVVAIYAAVISTLVVAVEVFRFWREMKSKVVVKFAIGSQAIGYENGTVSPWQLVINTSIVNHSLSERFINQPRIQIDKDDKVFTVLVRPIIKYPHRLSRGESHDVTYDAATIKDAAVKGGANRVRAIIDDTLGNTYYSKWIKLEDIHPYN